MTTADIELALREGKAEHWSIPELKVALQVLHSAPLSTAYKDRVLQMTETIRRIVERKESDIAHTKTQCIAKWGLGVGVAALLIGLLAFARDWFPEVFRPAATTPAAPLSTSAPVSVSATSVVALRATSTTTTAPPAQSPIP